MSAVMSFMHLLQPCSMSTSRQKIKCFCPSLQPGESLSSSTMRRLSKFVPFCARFFHNSDDCIIKATKVLTASSFDGTPERPNDPKGKWMTQVSAIPWSYVTMEIRAPKEIHLLALLSRLGAQYATLTVAPQAQQLNNSQSANL